jgi:hypothetical protein
MVIDGHDTALFAEFVEGSVVICEIVCLFVVIPERSGGICFCGGMGDKSRSLRCAAG